MPMQDLNDVTKLVVLSALLILNLPMTCCSQVITIEDVMDSKDVLILSPVASRFFLNSTPDDIVKYSYDDHLGIALLAKWEIVRITSAAKWFAKSSTDDNFDRHLPKGPLSQFLGYCEGRMSHEAPMVWKKCLLNGLDSGDGSYFQVEKFRSYYAFNPEARIWQGGAIQVTQEGETWKIETNTWSVEIEAAVFESLEAEVQSLGRIHRREKDSIPYFITATQHPTNDLIAIIIHRDFPINVIIAVFDPSDPSKPIWSKTYSTLSSIPGLQGKFSTLAIPVMHESSLYVYFAFSGGAGVFCLDHQGEQKWWFATDIVRSNNDMVDILDFRSPVE